MAGLTIKTFETILEEFNQKLDDFGSLITNRQEGGAYDLLIRISSRMIADLYILLEEALKQGFRSTASGEWLDLKAAEVGTERLEASKTVKELILSRDTDSGVNQIAIGDIVKSPVVPNVGSLRFFSIISPDPDQAAANLAGEFTSYKSNATAGTTPNVLEDTGVDFTTRGVQKGQKIYNNTDGSVGTITDFTATTIDAVLEGGTANVWASGDEYNLQSDLEITVQFEAEDPGSKYNNIENLLDVETVTFEIESGLSGVDDIVSNGSELIPGTDDETDEDLIERIIGRWSELAAGSTRQAYKNFAKNSSPQVYDANVTDDQKGEPTGVELAVSGPPGSRALPIGINAEAADNFDPNYTSDGTALGDPRPLGNTVHDYVRTRAPLTDIIFLKTVDETAQNMEVNILVSDGFDEDEVKADVKSRLNALFLPISGVTDVKVLEVGEDLLDSRKNKVIGDTPGVADYTFITPAPGVNVSVASDETLIDGVITVGDI